MHALHPPLSFLSSLLFTLSSVSETTDPGILHCRFHKFGNTPHPSFPHSILLILILFPTDPCHRQDSCHHSPPLLPYLKVPKLNALGLSLDKMCKYLLPGRPAPPCVRMDGFRMRGKEFGVDDFVEPTSGSELRRLLFPELLSTRQEQAQAAADAKTLLSSVFLKAHVKWYAIPCKSNATVAVMREALGEAVLAGQVCKPSPGQMANRRVNTDVR